MASLERSVKDLAGATKTGTTQATQQSQTLQQTIGRYTQGLGVGRAERAARRQETIAGFDTRGLQQAVESMGQLEEEVSEVTKAFDTMGRKVAVLGDKLGTFGTSLSNMQTGIGGFVQEGMKLIDVLGVVLSIIPVVGPGVATALKSVASGVWNIFEAFTKFDQKVKENTFTIATALGGWNQLNAVTQETITNAKNLSYEIVNTGTRFGLTSEQTMSYANALAVAFDPRTIMRPLQGTMSLFEQIGRIAWGTGQSINQVIEQAVTMNLQLAISAEQMATNYGYLAAAAERVRISVRRLAPDVIGITAGVAEWGVKIKQVAPIFADMVSNIRRQGFGYQVARDIAESVVKGLAQADLGTKAFYALRGGLVARGATAIGAGLRFEMALEGRLAGGLTGALGSVIETIRQMAPGRQIVTREMAVRSPALEGSFMVQRQLLKNVFQLSDAQGTRLLQWMKTLDQSGGQSVIAQKKIQEIMKSGGDIREKMLTLMQKMNLAVTEKMPYMLDALWRTMLMIPKVLADMAGGKSWADILAGVKPALATGPGVMIYRALEDTLRKMVPGRDLTKPVSGAFQTIGKVGTTVIDTIVDLKDSFEDLSGIIDKIVRTIDPERVFRKLQDESVKLSSTLAEVGYSEEELKRKKEEGVTEIETVTGKFTIDELLKMPERLKAISREMAELPQVGAMGKFFGAEVIPLRERQFEVSMAKMRAAMFRASEEELEKMATTGWMSRTLGAVWQEGGDIFKILGEKKAREEIQKEAQIAFRLRRQLGGFIPGFGGGDKVKALLEPGEFVVNKEDARANREILEYINAGRYQDGGWIKRWQREGETAADIAKKFALGKAGAIPTSETTERKWRGYQRGGVVDDELNKKLRRQGERNIAMLGEEEVVLNLRNLPKAQDGLATDAFGRATEFAPGTVANIFRQSVRSALSREARRERRPEPIPVMITPDHIDVNVSLDGIRTIAKETIYLESQSEII
jgi:hypothetical protein